MNRNCQKYIYEDEKSPNTLDYIVIICIGVRQGCVLSPKLFNLYTEKIFNESDELPGCIVDRENFNNLRYADDTVLLAESESALQSMADVVRQNSDEKRLSMNVKNTKAMMAMSQ